MGAQSYTRYIITVFNNSRSLGIVEIRLPSLKMIVLGAITGLGQLFYTVKLSKYNERNTPFFLSSLQPAASW